jgi:hypothetical protein
MTTRKPGTARRGGRIVGARDYDDEMTITVLAEGNPKKPGTKAHRRFELYRTGMKVRAYRKLAITKGYAKDGWGTLAGDVKAGFISVE